MVSEVVDVPEDIGLAEQLIQDFFKDFTSNNLDLKDLTSAELFYGFVDLQ